MSNDNNVTLRDIYDAVNRIEDKFDDRIKTVEQDVDELQAFHNRALGISSVLAAFVSLITTFIWEKITKQ